MKLLVLFFFLSTGAASQGKITVVKKNGDVYSLSKATITFSPSEVSSTSIFFTYGKKKKSISMKEVKRLNLKDVVSKKKGVITYEALLVKNNRQKMEIRLNLESVKGMDASNEEVEISANVIDKISF